MNCRKRKIIHAKFSKSNKFWVLNKFVETNAIFNQHVNLFRLADKVDTSETEYTFKGLESGVEYELSVKAGNENGTSQLSPSIQFITANEYRIESTRGVELE